jgi:triacylglycerol esterase/lipase EstA (alpha/beta hydrolase family)
MVGLLMGPIAVRAVTRQRTEDQSLRRDREARQRNPVIFVHGCPPPPHTDQESLQFTGPMMDYLRARGYPVYYLRTYFNSGPVCDSSITQAGQLAGLVDHVRAVTGAPRVDIVAHSMGSVVARLYLARWGGKSVRDFVALGGPFHGSQVAGAAVEWQAAFGYPAYEGAKEAYPPYACEGQTVQAADIQFALNGCLTPDGRTLVVDETRKGVDYLSIRNSLDEIINPTQSSCLNQRFQNDCSDTQVNVEMSVPAGLGPCGPNGAQDVCPAHVTMLSDPSVIQMTYNFLAGRIGRHHHDDD